MKGHSTLRQIVKTFISGHSAAATVKSGADSLHEERALREEDDPLEGAREDDPLLSRNASVQYLNKLSLNSPSPCPLRLSALRRCSRKLRHPIPNNVHCMNHRLNFVIVDVCKAIKPVRDFFSLLECLYVFLSGSAVHSMYVDVQKRLSLSVTELQRLSDTRWACQIAACRAAMKSFPVILVCLAEVIATNSRRATEARGLLEQMNFSFLFNLSLFTKVLSLLKVLADLLQSRDCSLSGMHHGTHSH